MKVITSIRNVNINIIKGDVFVLKLNAGSVDEAVINDDVLEDKLVEFIATYRYADDDGTVNSRSPVLVFYGAISEFPKLMDDGCFLSDLDRDIQANLLSTSGILIEKTDHNFDASNVREENKNTPLINQVYNRILKNFNAWATK